MNRSIRRRLWNKWRRFTIRRYARRDFSLDSNVPYVSFTFDDFPRSALLEGGRILTEHGVRGTFFTSLELLGRPSVSGPIATRDDLEALLRDGHEVGCHTFEHLDGCNSTVEAFEHSIEANAVALAECLPGERFPVFAYPLDGPVLSIKRAVGKHFAGCRFGGQSFNAGLIDLNLLNAYFIDQRNRADLEGLRTVIERNATARGWLIFATHDVATSASPYGCEPHYFEEAVRLSLQSGAQVLPMGQVCHALRIVT